MKMFSKRSGIAACLWAVAAMAHAQATIPATPPDTEAGKTFQRWDRNSDKTLSAAEFAAGWQEIQAANALRNLHDNFVAKDTDRNGSLGLSEYMKLDLIQNVGPAAPPFATFDADKNQRLDFKEYVGLVGALVKLKSQAKPKLLP